MSKKTEVITFRTSANIKAELEMQANKHGWSISQLVEKIITNEMTNIMDDAEETAKTIMQKIDNHEINNITELTKWAIQNDQFNEVSMAYDIWKEIFNELNNKT